MSLGDIIAAAREDLRENQWLHPMLMQKLCSHEVKKTPGPGDWISASKAPTWCPRNHVIAYRLGLEMVDDIDADGHWRMDKGSAIHSVLQDYWLGPMGVLKGGWKCYQCARIMHAGEGDKVTPETAVRMPKECWYCGFQPNRWDRLSFVEPWCYYDKWGIKVRGRTDGVIVLPPYPDEILDIKSTGSLRFVLEEPRDGDVKQVHWYMASCDIKRARLFYIDPGAKELAGAVVEHQVFFDEHLFQAEKEKMIGLQKALLEAEEEVPDCPYGGEGPFGPCACTEVEVLWSSHGDRSGAPVDGNSDSGPDGSVPASFDY